MAVIKVTPFGGNGGDAFGRQVGIEEIGLSAGMYVDQIRINGNSHGGSGGDDQGSIVLADDEYICKVDIRSGVFIDNVRFTTNKGNTIGGGGDGGNPQTLNNIRVLAIGGRAGKFVDKLDIMYVDGYQPSTIEQENVGFILSYTAPFETFYTYEKSNEKTIDFYQKITENMLTQKYSASVEGEYYVKVAASAGIEIKDSTLQTVRNELLKELSTFTSTKTKIPAGHVGISLVTGTLMKSKDDSGGDKYWMFPTSGHSYSIIDIKEEYTNLEDHYDLTGQLYTQVPGLKKLKKIKNGYVYYG